MADWNRKMKDLMKGRMWDLRDLRHATKLDQRALEGLLDMNTSQMPKENLNSIYELTKNADVKDMLKPDEPIIIAVWTHKGGVGKSTSAANISYALSKRGYNVLAIDTDSQSDMSSVLFPNYLDYPDTNFYQAFSMHDDFLYDGYIKNTEYTGLDIIPGSETCEVLEGVLCATPENIRAAIWEKCLRGIKKEGYYDFIIIDMDKTAGMLNTYAIAEADYVITPIEPATFSVKSLIVTMSHIDRMRKKDGKSQLLGLFYNKVDMRKKKALQSTMEMVDQLTDGKAFLSFIKMDANIDNSQNEHLPVCYYNPSTTASIQTEELTDEIIERIKKLRRESF